VVLRGGWALHRELAITGLSVWLRVAAAFAISAVVFAAGELTRTLIASRRPGADTERK